MKNIKKPTLLLALLLVPAALHVSKGASQADVRFCCTPQQVRDCAAIGGTSTCRPDNICRCLF